MTQSEVLNTALQYLLDKGAEEAYSYLKSNFGRCDEPYSSQIYSLRCCLAVQSGNADEALCIMNEAVIEKELWFRPEFFDDEVLAPVWKSEIYKQCRHKSDRLYTEARQKAKTFCTWDRVRANRIMVALHGNGQSVSDSKAVWQFAEELGWQTEYIQSKEPDSVGKFRWEDNSSAPYQIEAICGNIGWHDYDERALAGYGSGCNVILRTLNGGMLECEKIILVSPYIPMLDTQADSLYRSLVSSGSELMVICCKGDSVSGSYASRLVKGAMEKGIPVKFIEAEGSGVPKNLAQQVKPYIE
ncbi:MAG: hypothetical protein E7430_06510 [Ruminococcaceae bacterium]|nr:hypothetical protein [Oscillospiraceae bacterium]